MLPLPLQPPRRPDAPGYPTRARLLADPALRRRALVVLATCALAGCDSAAAPTTPSVDPPAASTPAASEPSEQVEICPEMTVTLGFGGAPTAPTPRQMVGDMAAPEPPPPVQLRDEEPQIPLTLPPALDADA